MGNCLTYAVGMLLAEGFVGRINVGIIWNWPPKLRFVYVNAIGDISRFAPLSPKKGFNSCKHALWFVGNIRKVN